MAKAFIKHLNRKYPLDKSFTLIGRDSTCDIVLDNDSVSKKHAFIVKEEQGYSIHDFKSLNGVKVDGQMVEHILLTKSREFQVGSETLDFELRDDPPPSNSRLKLEAPAAAEGHDSDVLRISLEKDIREILEDRHKRRDGPYQRLLILFKVSSIVSTMLETDDLLIEILTLALEVMSADRGFIMLSDDKGNLVPKVSKSRNRSNEADESTLVPVSRSIAENCFTNDVAILTNDTTSDERFSSSYSVVTYDIRSAMAVPLAYKGKRLGVLYLDNRLTSNVFTDADIELLKAFASQASVAIENSNLYKNLRESLEKIQSQREMLIQSEKLAAMGQLAAGVAHEIRNPLTAISGYLQLYFAKFPEDAPFHAQMKVMMQAVNQIRGVLEGLLGFARKSENRREPTPVNEVLERTLALAHHTLSRYNRVQVVQKFAGDLPNIGADPRQLQQVFLNFMINAAQAMPEGGTLTIQTKGLMENAKVPGVSHVMVVFSDTGHGIPEEKQGQIFQPFFTSGKKDGVGLGLTISKTIVDNHGGSITFESVEKKGTSFFIKLPIGTF